MQDVLTANAVIIGTTENFGYMSGLIKDFFERIYYPCLEKTQALPWALYVRAGKDGAGALRAVVRHCRRFEMAGGARAVTFTRQP